MSKQAVEIMYADLREGYAVLQGEYERLKDHCDELEKTLKSHAPDGRNYTNQQYVELLNENEELAAAYNNAQKEIRVLKNGGNEV